MVDRRTGFLRIDRRGPPTAKRRSVEVISLDGKHRREVLPGMPQTAPHLPQQALHLPRAPAPLLQIGELLPDRRDDGRFAPQVPRSLLPPNAIAELVDRRVVRSAPFA